MTLPETPDSPYWRGIGEGELVVRWCGACRFTSFPPTPFCPNCGEANGQECKIGRSGQLYSWIVIHRTVDLAFASDTPYVIGIVDVPVAKGLVRIPARIAVDDPSILSIDAPVILEPKMSRPGVTTFSLLPQPENRRKDSDGQT